MSTHSVVYLARRRRMRRARRQRDLRDERAVLSALFAAERDVLVHAAAVAIEVFGEDELERYAAEQRRTR